MELIARSCPICSQDSQHLHLKGNFQQEKLNEYSFSSRKEPESIHPNLYLCQNCDLLYANPALDQLTTNHEYENAAFDSSIEASYAARTYAKYLPQKSIITSALDIGTGGGEFLLELQKAGVKKLRGIEPSITAIETADPKIKPVIESGFFNRNSYQSEEFDLVSCFQTLEHVFDPLKLARDAHHILQKDGRFFIVAHNFRGFLNRMLGEKSPICDIEHFQLFSPRSLGKMLEDAGFKNIKIFPIINTYPLFYGIKLAPKIPAKKQLTDFSKKIKIGYLPLPFPLGNIGAIATK